MRGGERREGCAMEWVLGSREGARGTGKWRKELEARARAEKDGGTERVGQRVSIHHTAAV